MSKLRYEGKHPEALKASIKHFRAPNNIRFGTDGVDEQHPSPPLENEGSSTTGVPDPATRDRRD
jgi:hypothetical protein